MCVRFSVCAVLVSCFSYNSTHILSYPIASFVAVHGFITEVLHPFLSKFAEPLLLCAQNDTFPANLGSLFQSLDLRPHEIKQSFSTSTLGIKKELAQSKARDEFSSENFEASHLIPRLFVSESRSRRFGVNFYGHSARKVLMYHHKIIGRNYPLLLGFSSVFLFFLGLPPILLACGKTTEEKNEGINSCYTKISIGE